MDAVLKLVQGQLKEELVGIEMNLEMLESSEQLSEVYMNEMEGSIKTLQSTIERIDKLPQSHLKQARAQIKEELMERQSNVEAYMNKAKGSMITLHSTIERIDKLS